MSHYAEYKNKYGFQMPVVELWTYFEFKEHRNVPYLPEMFTGNL